MNVEYLKSVINPADLAYKILGTPIHQKGKANWYKSPLRAEERTASFEVSDRGFHDFGTGEHLDVIGFIQRYKGCSFKDACEYLKRLYGLSENEYETEEVRRTLERERLAMKAYTEKIKRWFVDFMAFVERAWDENEACINALPGYLDSLAILYDRQVFLGCLREEILEVDTFEDKERLRKQVMKEGLPEWMKSLEGYYLILES